MLKQKLYSYVGLLMMDNRCIETVRWLPLIVFIMKIIIQEKITAAKAAVR